MDDPFAYVSDQDLGAAPPADPFAYVSDQDLDANNPRPNANTPAVPTATQVANGYYDKQLAPNPNPDPLSSSLSELSRKGQLEARSAIQGVGQLASTLANPVAAVSNDVLGTKFPDQNALISATLDKYGFAQPSTPGEKLVNSIDEGAVGAATGAGLASMIASGTTGLTSSVANQLSQGLGSQVASGGLAGAGQSLAQQGGYGAGIQTLAALAGGLSAEAPNLASKIPDLLIGGTKGKENILSNLDTFGKLGTTPTLGQATEAGIPRVAESLLGKVPGSSGIIHQKAEQQAAQIGSKVNDMADSLSGVSEDAIAGQLIQKDIKNKYIPEAKETLKDLYNGLPLDENTPTSVKGIVSYLNNKTALTPGFENVSKNLISPGLENLKNDFLADTGGLPSQKSSILDENGRPYITPATSGSDTAPFSGVKSLRTKVGEKLDSSVLNPDTSTQDYKGLYGALSSAMEDSANKAGALPSAMYKMVNDIAKKHYENLDQVQPIMSAATPEKAFSQVTSNLSQGSTVLDTAMRMVSPQTRQAVSALMLRKLGKANPGQQDYTGNVFSTDTFIKNWSKLSNSAKQTLFGGYSPGFTDNMNAVAKVASNLKAGSKVYANPSGTAPAENAINQAGVIGAAILHNNPAALASAGAGIGLVNRAARAVTDPAFIRSLAERQARPMGSSLGSLGALGGITQQGAQ